MKIIYFCLQNFQSNESRRLEAVRRTGELDVDNKDLFIVFNELAKQISNMPVSYTGLMDQDRQFFYVILVCQMISQIVFQEDQHFVNLH